MLVCRRLSLTMYVNDYTLITLGLKYEVDIFLLKYASMILLGCVYTYYERITLEFLITLLVNFKEENGSQVH